MQTFQTSLKELWENIKGFFKKLNKTARILLGLLLVVLVGLAIAAAVLLNRKEYTVLFTNLTGSETSMVLQFLNDNGVTDFRIEGDSILVPEGREDQLQAQLIMSGNLTDAYLSYPFYLQNSSALGTSEEQKRIWLAAREQRMQAIIQRFDGVREALVQIAPGTERIYVLEDSATPTTVSVTITPDGNRALSDNVIQAIRYTVTHGIEGLSVSDVSIQDIYGSPYSDFASSTDMTDQATQLKLLYEERISNNVRRELMNALGLLYGEDNVRVSVLCTVDVSHQVIDKTTYDQPEGSVEGGGLVINDHLFYEAIRGDEEPVGGTVGTTTNSDLEGNFPNYPDWTDLNDGNNQYLGDQVDRDMVVDTTSTQMEVLEGRLQDLRVLVTVTPTYEDAGAVNIDAVRDSVATLAGISGTEDVLNRVSVIIKPFDEPIVPPSGEGGFWFLTPENSWILYAAIGGLVLFVILLVIILLLAGRRRKQRRLAERQAMEEAVAAEAAAEAVAILAEEAPLTEGADIMEVNTEKSMELRQEVRKFAQNNPEIAAQIVRAWLKGDDTGA